MALPALRRACAKAAYVNAFQDGPMLTVRVRPARACATITAVATQHLADVNVTPVTWVWTVHCSLVPNGVVIMASATMARATVFQDGEGLRVIFSFVPTVHMENLSVMAEVSVLKECANVHNGTMGVTAAHSNARMLAPFTVVAVSLACAAVTQAGLVKIAA